MAEANEEYQVERIVAHRVNAETGKIEYFLKWVNFSEDVNTWEPEEHLSCPELIAEYEAALEEQAAVVDPAPGVCGFERGLQPKEIMAVIPSNGKLLCVVKWENFDEYDFVPAAEVNVKCPQLVIQFYEKHIMMVRESGEKEPPNSTDSD